MADPLRVKICGLSTLSAVEASLKGQAHYLGFVFFEKSPRNVTPDHAASLAAYVSPGVAKVGLMVNPTDADLDRVTGRVPLDMIQLHGRETPERVRAVKVRTGLPVMKAVGVAETSDLATVESYIGAADQILVDAKPAPGSDLPGGNGLSFDWTILHGRRWPVPWMLAGGLTVDNMAEAVRRTGALQIDVSSGVESAPGVKDEYRIKAFLDAARAVDPETAAPFV